MNLNPLDFSRSFIRVAPKVVEQSDLPAATKAQLTNDLATLGQSEAPAESRGIFAKLRQAVGLQAKLSPAQTEQQAKQALSTACQLVGPSIAAVVAQKVGLELFDAKQEQEIGKATADKNQAKEGYTELWGRAQKYASRPMDCKTVENGHFGPAMFMGSTILLNRSEMDQMAPSVQLFLLAHEMGHIENRDSAGKIGLNTLTVLEPTLSFDPDVASKEMEYAADRFAAKVVAKEGLPPQEILRTLAEWPGGGTHPLAEDRIRAVRDAMAVYGTVVSDGDLKKILDETAPVRQAAREKERQARELRESFDNLV